MMILLRLIHILTGITWVGAMIFVTFFLIPVFRGAEPSLAGKVMQGLAKRGYMQLMPAIAMLTLLSGLAMIWIMSGGNLSMYMQTRSGHAFTTAGGLAILAFALGIAFGRPTGIKAAALGAQIAATTDGAEKAKLLEEMAALQKKSGMISVGVTILLIIAAAGMAIARYV